MKPDICKKGLCAVLLVAITAVCVAQDVPKATQSETGQAKPAAKEPTKPAEPTEPATPEPPKPTEPPDPVPTPTEGLEIITTESGLKYIDMKVGDGQQPVPNCTVTVHYSGWLEDGTLFDTSLKGGEPRKFNVSRGIITGWTEGLLTMRVGGKRKLIVPSELGYGARGRGEIPPNATLTFEIELVDVNLPPQPTPVDSLTEMRLEFALKYWDIKVGEGESPLPEGRANMHYSLWLEDGTPIDSTYLRDDPRWHPLAQLFPGWTEGVLTMKPGGKRRLEIPPVLGLGRRGRPNMGVPANSTIIIEVELLEVENPETDKGTEEKTDAPAGKSDKPAPEGEPKK